MKAHTLLFVSLTALCACSGPDTSSNTAKDQPESPKAAVEAPASSRVAKTPESGRSGLWADVDSLCFGKRESARLMWNVALPPRTRVELYRIRPDGTEQLIARGAAVGERPLGRWLSAGMTFALRPKGSTRELGRLVIPGKHC